LSGRSGGASLRSAAAKTSFGRSTSAQRLTVAVRAELAAIETLPAALLREAVDVQ